MPAHRRPTPEMHHHPTHDLALIAALSADDLSGADRARAQTLVDTCSDCAAVHADLLAIAAATRSLPAAATAPRDYRLSPEQAARLHRRSWLRTFLAPFAGATSAARPLATAFTSLGLVGLLVVTVLPGMLGGAASMAPERQSTGGAGAAAAPTAAPAAPALPSSAAAQNIDTATASTVPGAFGPDSKSDSTPSAPPDAAYAGQGHTASPGTPGEAVDGLPRDAELPSPGPANPLLVGSLVLLAIGLGLFALRFAGRRLG